MRVLLRNRNTGCYFAAPDRWIADRHSARDFGTSGRAILFAMENRLAGLEVVLAFDNAQYDVAIPLQNGLPDSPLKKPYR